MKWESVIGLEIHAQISSRSKLFSDASVSSASDPNAKVSLIDIAAPGALPSLNRYCVEQAIKTGLALNSDINNYCSFDRKNYFYHDLPFGYQITQFYHPIAVGGHVFINSRESNETKIRIHHIHMEQDAGKSIHDYIPGKTHIDLNRAGVPLMEIVSEPDMRSAEDAVKYASILRHIMIYIGTCDGNMELGSFRCDANVSVRPMGESKLGTRCEIKNLNSMKYLSQAINYEIQRQIDLISVGNKVVQQTRMFDVKSGKTKKMRDKEEADDYRYFKDPDVPSFYIDKEFIESIKLPELPDQKISRYVNDLSLSSYDARVIVSDKSVADFFEIVIQKHDPALSSKWITIELFARLNKLGLNIDSSPVTPARLVGLLDLLVKEVVSSRLAKEILDKMFTCKDSAKDIAEKNNMLQVTSESDLVSFVEDVISSNMDKVYEYKNGKEKIFGFLIGQVMKKSEGKACPKLTASIMKRLIKNI